MTTITVSTALSTFDQLESAARSYCRGFRHVLTSAAGSIVRDSTGREYIDFLANAGALNYGHNDPDLKAALIDYLLEDGITASLDLHTNVKAVFLATFDQVILAPWGLDYRVQFTGPTGTKAVEAALKLARKVTGRTNVIAFTNAFHGVTAGSLAATASSHHRMRPEQGLHRITRVTYDGLAAPWDGRKGAPSTQPSSLSGTRSGASSGVRSCMSRPKAGAGVACRFTSVQRSALHASRSPPFIFQPVACPVSASSRW